MRKQVIAYLHTHWDREWYREFEIFRMRLLRVFDNVLDMLDTNKIPCFYFDGQVSALEDYLEIRPEKEPLVRTLIAQKKLFIGPFYCLVDEFLTDKTCFIKNLELGMKKAIDFGCTDFIGYLPDTFGHSENVVDILRDFGINKCVVWRGCGDFPSEFKWCGMDTVNLVRGYFNDVFSLKCSVEEKAEILKKTLDAISQKSEQYILLPVGADHLGVPNDIQDQILAVNDILKEDYNIKLGSPFDFFRYAHNFNDFEYNGELRDNSKTFTLQGCYSSRLDLKRYNVLCSHKLELASKLIRFAKADEKYAVLLDYAYKMLIQNQAHDGICGCSTDDTHSENIIRYKKILQIADTIIDELKFETNFNEKMILNLSDEPFSGIVEFESSKPLKGFQKISSRYGFDKKLLTDTQRIPVTEDYQEINTYLAEVWDLQPNEMSFIDVDLEDSDLEITETSLSNSKIQFNIELGQMFINGIPVSLIDFVDDGDSYNNGPKEDDKGSLLKIYRSKVVMNGKKRAALKIDFEGLWDIVSVTVSLDKGADSLKFDFDWVNTQKNHLLEVKFDLPDPIYEVFSEDMNTIIRREFDPNYDIRKNLPKTRGLEAKTNTAPMQRGLFIDEMKNNIGIITKGLTQYEIFQNSLYLPILRATGVISNPKNPARSTPAGPPLETPLGQMQGENRAEFHVFFGHRNAFDRVLRKVYNYIII